MSNIVTTKTCFMYLPPRMINHYHSSILRSAFPDVKRLVLNRATGVFSDRRCLLGLSHFRGHIATEVDPRIGLSATFDEAAVLNDNGAWSGIAFGMTNWSKSKRSNTPKIGSSGVRCVPLPPARLRCVRASQRFRSGRDLRSLEQNRFRRQLG